MNDHQSYYSKPPHKLAPPPKKGFLASTFSRLFYRFPKNRHDLMELIHNAHKFGLTDNETDDMLAGVMKIADLRVRDIMIPRSQITTIKRHQTLSQCLSIIIESAHSRFPVISEDKDHIEGLLMAKDLLPYIHRDAEPFSLDKLLRPAVMVPESKRVDHILKEFRCQHYHLAIVVDEFGSVSGLITIEDILEQIVGDIVDEYDNPCDRTIRQLSDHTFSIHALTTIEDFNNTFGTDYNNSEVDTIGGLVMQAFGYLPDRGETVDISNYHFKVTRADSRHIMQLQVTLPRTKVTDTPR